MIDVEESVRIDRTVDDVYAVVIDAADRPEWKTSAFSAELTSPPPIGVGSTMRTQMSVLGQDLAFEWRVDEFTPPRSLKIVSTSGPLPATVHFALAPAGTAATDLTVTLTAEPQGMMRMVEPVIESSIRTQLASSLTKLATHLNTAA